MITGSFGLGYKALRALSQSQDTIRWYHAKLTPEMFKPGEVEAFLWASDFLKKHHKLPTVETLAQNFPEIAQVPAPEPPSFYVEHLENRMYYETINQANIDSQTILKANQAASKEAEAVMQSALAKIKAHRYRVKIMNFAKEGPTMVMNAYQNVMLAENVGVFGWEFMDKSSGGIMPGDVITYIGRPAAGKTWLVLRTALENWRKGRKILFVSMEMAPLPIAQRLVSMFAGHSISQIKMGGVSYKAMPAFSKSLLAIGQMQNDFWVIDGNLAADIEDIYLLADMLGADQVYIDGAYLCRNRNKKLDRYTRVAENAELMKQFTSDTGKPTIASYQFARTASKKGKGVGASKEVAGLEDIGYSDVIGQISTVSLALDQEESVETIASRIIRVMKGRNGETGQFKINWDFGGMDFDQVAEANQESKQLGFV